jgi:tetratricopeptide (TPR) repeat protein
MSIGNTKSSVSEGHGEPEKLNSESPTVDEFAVNVRFSVGERDEIPVDDAESGSTGINDIGGANQASGANQLTGISEVNGAKSVNAVTGVGGVSGLSGVGGVNVVNGINDVTSATNDVGIVSPEESSHERELSTAPAESVSDDEQVEPAGKSNASLKSHTEVTIPSKTSTGITNPLKKTGIAQKVLAKRAEEIQRTTGSRTKAETASQISGIANVVAETAKLPANSPENHGQKIAKELVDFTKNSSDGASIKMAGTPIPARVKGIALRGIEPTTLSAMQKFLLFASHRPVSFDVGLLLVMCISSTLYVFSMQRFSHDLELGSDLLAHAQYAEAVKVLNRAIAANNTPDAHILRARAFRLMGDSKHCRDDYIYALHLQPENGEVLQALGQLSFEERDYKKASDYFARCIRFSTGNQQRLLDARTSLASAYMYNGRFELAAEVYKDIFASRRSDVGALLNSARCWLALHRIDLALEDCTNALKIQPNSIDALLLRASCYEEAFDKAKALADLNSAVEKEPKNPGVLCARGRMFANFKNFANAYKDYDKAISLNANYYPVYLERAKTYLLAGDQKKCAEQLSSLAAMTGYQPSADYIFARALLKKSQQRYQESLDLSQEALVKDRINAAKYSLNIADCYYALKKFEPAMLFCDKVLKDQPNNSRVILMQADINQARGDEHAAKLDLFQAVALEPLNPEVFEKRAKFFLANKQYGAAGEDYQRALRLEPSSSVFSKQLAFCQQKSQAMHGQANESDKQLLSTNELKEIATSDPQTLTSSGYAALKQSKFAYAVAALSRAVSLKPDDPLIRHYLAYAFIASGDCGSAIEQFFAWEKLERISDETEIEFVKSVADAGQLDNARALVDQLFKKFSKNSSSLLKLARLCAQLKLNSTGENIVKMGLKIASPEEKVEFEKYAVSFDRIEEPPKTQMDVNPIGKS